MQRKKHIFFYCILRIWHTPIYYIILNYYMEFIILYFSRGVYDFYFVYME